MPRKTKAKVQQGGQNDGCEKATSETAQLSLSLSIMRRLWGRMVSIYGHRWSSAYGDLEHDNGSLTMAGDSWSRGLRTITPEQLAQGLDACLMSPDGWPPTLPAFRALCLGIPSRAAVFADLRASTARRAPFTRLVWSYLDTWRFARSDQQAADRALMGAYALAVEHVMGGGPLPEPSPEIEHQPTKRTPAAPETVQAAMRDIAEQLA